MKALKKDLQSVMRDLKSLTKKTERMAKKLNKLAKAQAAKKAKAKTKVRAKAKTRVKAKAKTRVKTKAKAKVKVRPARKKKVAKKVAVKKGTRGVASDTIFKIIAKRKKGVGMEVLKAQTGFKDKKIRDIIYRLKKQGKIKSARAGVYVKL